MPKQLKSTERQRDKEAQVAHTFDEEERELLASFETEAWHSAPEAAMLKQQLEEAARVTLAKSERITVRLTPSDLQAIKHKAAQEGLPYQTLIASLLHKYASGRLKDV